jgi:succinate-semialdehyde dehydrogenase/glutarate-semialdehyde dehydrogenase
VTSAELMKLPTELLIGGAWCPATRGGRIDVVDPSSATVIASVADADTTDASAAIDAAANAAAGWAATAPRERAELLRSAYESMIERREWFAELISTENGKSLADARGEVSYAAEFFRWYAEETVRVRGDLAVAPSGGNRILVTHQPIGICVLVTPWNFPAAMATRKIAPALGAGCTVVLKPASETPLTALAIADLLTEVGIPAGVVNVLTTSTSGPVVGAMLADTRTRMVSFTGSTEVGRVLLRTAADRVLKSSMELGGNAPFVVLDDADVESALDGAMVAKMRNGGQACTAANRFYVHDAVYDVFAAGLGERMAGLVVGAGTDPASDCGPLINAAAVAKVEELVAGAVERGARVVTGGHRLDRAGFFYAPTVLADVPPDAAILREEIFGPVAALVRFGRDDDGDDDAAVAAAAHDTIHGLVSYVYTRDLARGLRLAERLETGMVGLNRGLVSDPAAPFGGVKESGLGREGGAEGLHEFLESKYVATSW